MLPFVADMITFIDQYRCEGKSVLIHWYHSSTCMNIHCRVSFSTLGGDSARGKSRSACLAIAYLMVKGRLSAAEATARGISIHASSVGRSTFNLVVKPLFYSPQSTTRDIIK
jgi:hypothetical protein